MYEQTKVSGRSKFKSMGMYVISFSCFFVVDISQIVIEWAIELLE